MRFANGNRVTWVSNTGRVRTASIITKMKVTLTDDHLIRVTDGPSLVGATIIIPARRLTIKADG